MPVGKSRSNAKPLSLQWAKTIQRIPGYDPVATAGDCIFDGGEAKRRLDFCKQYLTHVKGELGGKPFVPEPWEKAIIANIFGWRRPDGTRRYREAFLFVPRKNGKTYLAAAILCSILFQDDERGMEIYSAAADREQASLIFSQVEGMILQNPELNNLCQIYKTARSVVRDNRSSSYKVISADANTKHGFNSHAVAMDELHAQPNRELVDVLITSTGARREPLILHTTTSDFERPSICNEKYDYACKVRDGIIDDPSFLPIIYEAPKEWEGETCDYTNPAYYANPAIWQHANPNLGVSLSVEYMERECKRAQETPSYLNTFLRLHLNVRTQQDIAWLSMTDWDACYDSELSLADFHGQVCYAGFDLANTSDLIALALLFPDLDNAVLCYFWLPADTALQRERRSRVPYPAWAQQGHIRLTPGNVADYERIRADINEIGTQFKMQEIAIDEWNAAQIITQLSGDGFDVVPFRQGYKSLSGPSKELERLLLAREIRHDGNPVLRWCASNVMLETDAAGNIKPSKARSSEKIDGIVALVMALGRAMVRPEDTGSVYETRGILTL
jgi:phage terminase large subunit-like protein